MPGGGVNRARPARGALWRCWAVLVLVVPLGCRLGRPPPAFGSLTVLEVSDPSAEAGLAAALQHALASELERQGARSSSSDEAAVQVRVLSAETAVAGAAGLAQVHRAELEVELTVLGPAPRSLVLRSDHSYTVAVGDPAGASQARTLAFQALAEELGQEAIRWLLYAPQTDP